MNARTPMRVATHAMRPVIADALGLSLDAPTIAEAAVLERWSRIAGGDRRRLLRAVASVAVPVLAMTGPLRTLAPLDRWVVDALRGRATLVASPLAIRSWLWRARANDRLIYHVGALAVDRASDPVVDATARVALEMDRAGVLRCRTARTALDDVALSLVYRTDAPLEGPLAQGAIEPVVYRRLLAIAERGHGVSPGNALRLSGGVLRRDVPAALDDLRDRGLVAEAARAGAHRCDMGLMPTPRGWEMLAG